MSITGRQVVDIPFPLNPSRSNQTYELMQSYELPAWQTSSTTVPTFQANSFTLSSLDQVATLVAFFDQYKIAHIRVVLIPRLEVTDGNVANAGLFTSVIDFDDATALASIGGALDFQNALTSRGTETHTRTFVPHVATAAYSGAFTSFANEPAPWLDTSSSSITHYGVKTAWTATSTALIYDAIVTLHIKFRNVR